jgi:hypothetical protein
LGRYIFPMRSSCILFFHCIYVLSPKMSAPSLQKCLVNSLANAATAQGANAAFGTAYKGVQTDAAHFR